MRLWGITRPRLPDAFTLGNASCGVLAVLTLAVWGNSSSVVGGLSTLQVISLLLVVGTIFDSLDGAAARVFGGSRLGGALDSLSDGLTFGLVPPLLLTMMALSSDAGITAGTSAAGGPSEGAIAVVVIGLLLYVAGALLRLADFSSVRTCESDFVGLPSPLAALLAVAAAYTTTDPVLLGCVLIGVGYLMVSGLRFPHQGREMLPLAVGGWVLVVCGALHVVDPPLLAAATYVLVLVVLPVLASRSRRRAEDDDLIEGAPLAPRALLTD